MSAQTTNKRLYKTSTTLKRTVRVVYPVTKGRLVVRTEQDWDRNIEPVSVTDDGTTSIFQVQADQPYLYFKPCLVIDAKTHWKVGPNNLVLMGATDDCVFYPHFFSPDRGRFSRLIEFPSRILDRIHRGRVYLPPGYDENTLATYAAAFMQDGQNLFFPNEAFLGREWEVDETTEILRSMGAVEDFIIIGINSDDRMRDYTSPGYEAYAQSLAQEILPEVQRLLRVGSHRRDRTVWGSSLGGVVSFYTVWQYPQLFGTAVCMSSTFSHRDDLIERVLNEPPRDVSFYLDSGWPGDNYEVTMGMAMALVSRGWKYGDNLMHLCFPHAEHDERAWGLRLHLPMQFLNGAVARSSRQMNPVLSDLA